MMRVYELGFKLCFPLLIMLTACNQTHYYDLNESPKQENLFTRDVHHSLKDDYYFIPPDCVVVASTSGTHIPIQIINLTAEVIATKLRRYYHRVIDDAERQILERRLGLETRNSSGMNQFSRLENCPVYLEWHLKKVESTQLIIWSQRRIGLHVRLVFTPDNSVLWEASHIARRSSGAPPFSLLSVPMAAVDAHLFTTDEDHIPSMIDDLVRRIFITLPKLV